MRPNGDPFDQYLKQGRIDKAVRHRVDSAQPASGEIDSPQ